MPPSDTKHYPLATNKGAPRARRSISVRDYALPKPYRRKRFVEDGPGKSRLRMAMLTLSVLLIAGLVGALVVLARTGFDAPPVPIVAAPRPAPAPLAQEAPTVSAPDVPAAAPPAVVAAPARPERIAAEPPTARAVRAPQATPQPQVPAPDPDVVLIAAILTLTPPPEPATLACLPSAIGDSRCPVEPGSDHVSEKPK